MVQKSWVAAWNPEVWKGWMWRLTLRLVLNLLWWRWVAWFQANTWEGTRHGKMDGNWIWMTAWNPIQLLKNNFYLQKKETNSANHQKPSLLNGETHGGVQTGTATPDPCLKCIDLRQTLCHWKGISEGLAMASFHGAGSRWKFQRLQCLGDLAGALAED